MSFGGGGTGSSKISTSQDVALSNPTDGQVLTYDGTLAKWKNAAGGGAVTSVAGKTGAVVLVAADVGLGNVDNTADTAKPVSTAQQAALDAKVTIDVSPAGNPGTPVWTRRLTTALTTTWSNMREVWVGTAMASWLNEWGALRGTGGYSWGDALVRAVRSDSLSSPSTSSAIEVVDRRTGVSNSPTLWGVGWDGVVRVGGTSSSTKGTAIAPCVVVAHGAAAPAGLPDGTLIFELPA